MSEPLDVLLVSDEPVEPDPEFRAAVLAHVREALMAPEEIPTVTSRDARSLSLVRRRRTLVTFGLVAGAAAAVVAVLVVARTPRSPEPARDRPATTTAATPAPVTTAAPTPTGAPESTATPAPTTDSEAAATAQPGVAFLAVVDGKLQVGGNGDLRPLTSEGTEVSEKSPWGGWSDPIETVTGWGGIGGGEYIATCCVDGGTIWRNGQRQRPGSQLDLSWRDGLRYAFVDPARSSVRLNDLDVTVADVLDAAWLDDQNVAVLTGGQAPAIVVITGTDFARGDDLTQRSTPLPVPAVGACALGSLAEGVALLIGVGSGSDPCVGERIVIVEPGTGALVGTLDLPAPLRTLASNRDAFLSGATVAGDVVTCVTTLMRCTLHPVGSAVVTYSSGP